MDRPALFRDLGKLRSSLLLLAAVLLGGAAAVVAGQRAAEGGRVLRDAAQARATGLQARLAAATADEAGIRRRIERYGELAARGIVGPEKRMEWVERIEAVGRDRKLLDIRYEFSPQVALDAAADDISASGYRLMASAMRLHMQLLHEDDLSVFLADLVATAPALLRTRDCVVERTGSVPARLRADCVIDWITLRELP